MDVTTFYALFSATCFTLVGLWWSVIEKRSDLVRAPAGRREVGAVYLTFLLPGLMGLFAQVGGTQSPLFWRVSFVLLALVGAVTGARLALADLEARLAVRFLRWSLVLVFVVVAVVGALPTLARSLGVTPLQVEASLLIVLVAMAHGLAWEYLTHGPKHAAG